MLEGNNRGKIYEGLMKKRKSKKKLISKCYLNSRMKKVKVIKDEKDYN
jgi:hypothetical protein